MKDPKILLPHFNAWGVGLITVTYHQLAIDHWQSIVSLFFSHGGQVNYFFREIIARRPARDMDRYKQPRIRSTFFLARALFLSSHSRYGVGKWGEWERIIDQWEEQHWNETDVNIVTVLKKSNTSVYLKTKQRVFQKRANGKQIVFFIQCIQNLRKKTTKWKNSFGLWI